MPKRLCKCGETLQLGGIPCDIEYKFISDVDYEKYYGQIDSEELYLNMNSFVKCPKCDRLWVYWNGFDKQPEEYVFVKNND